MILPEGVEKRFERLCLAVAGRFSVAVFMRVEAGRRHIRNPDWLKIEVTDFCGYGRWVAALHRLLELAQWLRVGLFLRRIERRLGVAVLIKPVRARMKDELQSVFCGVDENFEALDTAFATDIGDNPHEDAGDIVW
jgi:hypothetical protein